MTPASPIPKYGLDSSCSRQSRAPMTRVFVFLESKIMLGFHLGHSNGLMRVASLLLCAALPGAAQTQIHLQTQSKAIDFANANSTRPAKTGTTLPAVCGLGEVFFKSNATAGSNLFGCTATNTWTQMSGSSGGTIGTLGGDVTGNASSGTVVALRNRSISTTAPSSGQVLGWNSIASVWEPQTPATTGGGGGGGGVQVPFLTTFVSGSALSIGTGCNGGSLCIARFGNTSYQFANAFTATIGAGTGTAYVYISASGSLTVGHNMTVACSIGCTTTSGVTSFPADSIPLYTWTANSSGQWDANGGTDWRATISTKNVSAGVGLVEASVGGATTLSLDTAAVGLRVGVPSSSAAACTSGFWAADAGFFYICTANNTWQRVALATW